MLKFQTTCATIKPYFYEFSEIKETKIYFSGQLQIQTRDWTNKLGIERTTQLVIGKTELLQIHNQLMHERTKYTRFFVICSIINVPYFFSSIMIFKNV